MGEPASSPITIGNYRLAFEREPLSQPFHFKGGFFTEKWLIVTALESVSGARVTAIGGLAVLWSDPSVFFSYSEAGGNMAMAVIAEKAAQLARGRPFDTPIDMIESLLPEVYSYAVHVTGNEKLRKTFALNALVSLDMALWKLYARERGVRDFDEMIPAGYRPAFAHRQEAVARLPVVGYHLSACELKQLAEDGVFFFKIKIGHAGSRQEMLEKDKARLEEIHTALKDFSTPHTESGHPLYYLDANGRYESKEDVQKLLGHAGKIGMLDRIALLEEPFPEEIDFDVSDLPVRVAADESLHDAGDVARKLDLGYEAFALKPAGKTLSMSLVMGKAAWESGQCCFVADSGCVPLLVEWNKNIAARLDSFPGLSMSILESNGAQLYGNWDNLVEDHPCHGAPWIESREGLFHLDRDYYARSGGILMPPGHYEGLLPGGAE